MTVEIAGGLIALFMVAIVGGVIAYFNNKNGTNVGVTLRRDDSN